MLLTLDNELSDLATDLKWADWSTHYTFADKLDSD